MIIDQLKSTFGKEIMETRVLGPRRATFTVGPDFLPEMARYLHAEMELRFIIASALHTRRGFEIYYHFSHDATGLICNLHVVLDQDNPEVDSLSNMFEASNWIEREMHELFGINFRNHPNLEALISEGNWATGEYPYRKHFKTNGEAAR
jgi:NADH-quinone oxidoreductase subunit C